MLTKVDQTDFMPWNAVCCLPRIIVSHHFWRLCAEIVGSEMPKSLKPKELLCVCGYIVLWVFIFGSIRMVLASTRSNKPLLNIVFTVGGDCLVAHRGQDASFREKKRIGA